MQASHPICLEYKMVSMRELLKQSTQIESGDGAVNLKKKKKTEKKKTVAAFKLPWDETVVH